MTLTGTLALLAHRSPDSIVAHRGGHAVSAAQFLADVASLAAHLPAGSHVLNVCLDRYRFAVGVAACLTTGRVSLLPSTHTPEMIEQLLRFAPDVFCLSDDVDCRIELPRCEFPADLPVPADQTGTAWRVPRIPATRLAAIVFTSGSTGTPLPYRKTWGRLARCVRDGAHRLGLLDGRAHTVIGTVPAQHMYGFESTVLLALLSGNAFTAERPFYPADVCADIARAPRPRALISTPVHLRAVLAAGVALPPVDLVVSATAPLALELAHEVESRFDTVLLEIYGSTETGQIATRRTAETAAWRLWPGVRLHAQEGSVFAQGGHVEQLTAMCDVIEIQDDEHFLLQGRTADLVNVAGKRSSFAYLNAQLMAIPGVLDGAFFLRESAARREAGARGAWGAAGVTRLAALAVAPGMTSAAVTEHLRRRIDPIFLPRPLLLLDRLPRNATGKLPQHALQALVERNRAVGAMSERLDVPADHPAFGGHFPGFPILPGAVLLDAALHEIACSRNVDLCGFCLSQVKFLEVVRPGVELVLQHAETATGAIRFTVLGAGRPVATGTLAPSMSSE